LESEDLAALLYPNLEKSGHSWSVISSYRNALKT
jgi:hypothetical protein